MTSLILKRFQNLFCVFIADFNQVNTGWEKPFRHTCSNIIVSEQCSKKYKTNSGLKLNRKKHFIDVTDDNKIHERQYFKEAIEKACKKVLEEKLHSKFIINEVESIER